MPESVAPPVLCVDIGGTSTKAGILAANAEVHFLDSIPTRPDVCSFHDALLSLIGRTLAAGQAEGLDVRHLGLAVAGFLDPARERLVYNSNLAWLEGFPLRLAIAERFPALAIELEIDSNAATMAEYRFGSGQGSERFLCVTPGTGLGVGMTVNGEPLRFAYGCMGDVGHIIVQKDGPLCTCGGRGCAEIMISAPVVAENYRLRAGLPAPLSLRDVIEAAHRGESLAVAALNEAGEWLGVAIASMANTFFPDHIAIAGGLSAGGVHVLEPAQRMFNRSACIFARERTTFTQAKLGSLATLIGAAWPFWSKEASR